jgi:XTP/dITP diphosphohydrolase
MRRPARLLLATHNAGKVEEMRALLAPLAVTIEGAGAWGLPVPEETEDSFEGNARLKARAAAAVTGWPALGDDSGIEVMALGGAPGVRTADWAERPGGGRDFLLAMTRTRDALVAAGAAEPWRARFVCVLALATPEGDEAVFPGEVLGRVVWPPRGMLGHGYDPVFVPEEGDGRTFAEMAPEEKNALSHRARATARLLAWLDAR